MSCHGSNVDNGVGLDRSVDVGKEPSVVLVDNGRPNAITVDREGHVCSGIVRIVTISHCDELPRVVGAVDESVCIVRFRAIVPAIPAILPNLGRSHVPGPMPGATQRLRAAWGSSMECHGAASL